LASLFQQQFSELGLVAQVSAVHSGLK